MLASLVVNVHRVERGEAAGGHCWAGHHARHHVAVAVGELGDVGQPLGGGRRAHGAAEEARRLAVVLGPHGDQVDAVHGRPHFQGRAPGHAAERVFELFDGEASEAVLDVQHSSLSAHSERGHRYDDTKTVFKNY